MKVNIKSNYSESLGIRDSETDQISKYEFQVNILTLKVIIMLQFFSNKEKSTIDIIVFKYMHVGLIILLNSARSPTVTI